MNIVDERTTKSLQLKHLNAGETFELAEDAGDPYVVLPMTSYLKYAEENIYVYSLKDNAIHKAHPITQVRRVDCEVIIK